MEYFTKEQRAFAVECFFRRNESVVQVQREFRKKFNIPPRKPIPARGTILNWVKNFRKTGSALNRKSTGRRKSVRTSENIERVRGSVINSPRRSIRKRSQVLGITRESLRQILRKDLRYHPFKLAVTQKLEVDDFAKRKTFAEKMLDKIESKEINEKNILMTDEAHFHLTGAVNKQNFRYWAPASENPGIIQEKPLHDQRVTVWAGVASWGVVGPYFFDGTVNTKRYTEMLETFLFPALRHHRRLSSTWFQQDGATCHTANKTLEILGRAFGRRIISKRALFEWPPRSPDLTAPDFFLWGYLKSRVYSDRPKNLEELKQRIRDEISKITPDVTGKVVENWISRLKSCVAADGHHLSDVVFHK